MVKLYLKINKTKQNKTHGFFLGYVSRDWFYSMCEENLGVTKEKERICDDE